MAHPRSGLTEKGAVQRAANSCKDQPSFIHQIVQSLHLVPGVKLEPGAEGLVGKGPLRACG